MLLVFSKIFNNSARDQNKILFSICLLVFIDAIGLGLIIPILPSLFLNKSIGLMGGLNNNLSNLFYGIAIALYPLASIFGMPILGMVSDIIGRKTTLLYGLIGLLIGYIASIFAILSHNVWLFFLARIIAGFSSGTYSVANASAMDASIDEDKKINSLKYITFFYILGFVIGPGISAFIHNVNSSLSLSVPFFIAAFLCVANIIIILFSYPSVGYSENYKIVKYNIKNSFKPVLFIFHHRLRALFIAYIIFNLGFEIFLQSQSIYLSEVYNLTANKIGLYFVLMGLIFSASLFFIHPLAKKKMSCELQIKYASFLMGAILFAYYILNEIHQFSYPGALSITVCISAIFYILTPLITLNMTKTFSALETGNVQGSLMGALGQISSFATIFGSLLMSGILYLDHNLNAGIGGLLILLSAFLIGLALPRTYNKTEICYEE